MSINEILPSAKSLLVFESAARHLSFTRAALEMGSTQPAVSQQVRVLEEHLGIQLFVRIYRGVELTEAGKRLFEAVGEGFELIGKTILELQNQKLHPRINVATDFALAAYWLLPRLSEFRQRYPGIDIRILTSQGKSNFTSNEVDVEIVLGDGQFPHRRSSLLFREQAFPVCSAGFLEQHGPIESAAALAKLPLLKLDADDGQHWLDWKKLFRAIDGNIEFGEPVMSFNNYTLLVQAAIAGQGVCLGWGTLIDELLDNGVLVALPEFSVSSDLGYYVVESDNSEPAPEIDCFVAWLNELEQRRA